MTSKLEVALDGLRFFDVALGLSLGAVVKVEMLALNPAKEPGALGEDVVLLEIVGRDGMLHAVDLRREGAARMAATSAAVRQSQVRLFERTRGRCAGQVTRRALSANAMDERGEPDDSHS